MLAVDTHAHLFSPDERRYPPRKNPSRPPAGTGTIEHLRREMSQAGVRAACAVQVSGFYGIDNRYLLDVAKQHADWIAGIVTLSPDDELSPALLAEYVNDYGIRGMRSVPARDGRLDHPGVRELWRACWEHGVPVNLLARHEHADQAMRLARDFPQLPVVLDHCLRLEAGSHVSATLKALEKLARLNNVHAKLSSIANGPQGCLEGYPCERFHEAILRVIELFGPERCCWGAHFPLEKYAPKLTYAQHLQIYAEVLPLSASAREQILGGTANRLWFGGRLSE